MRQLLVVASFFLLTIKSYPSNISYYKSQIAFLYLYHQHFGVIYELTESSCWTESKSLKHLKTSLSLIKARYQDFRKVRIQSSSKRLNKKIKLCFTQAIQATTLFISGLEGESDHWQKGFLPVKQAWDETVIILSGMEE
ncbi:MAG: hypothetical protein OEZ36_07920 [Spirochaetota bacterium]|nr:hypothetical protein [Spirochaetota bacterium]